MEEEAPSSLQCAYALHGEDVAEWLRPRPVAKVAVRSLMDRVVEGLPAEAAGGAGHMAVQSAEQPAVFVVLPSKSRVVRVPTVCLEHGKRVPHSKVPYRMVAFSDVSSDPRVADLLKALSSGMLTQNVAQAVAWHLSSGRSWDQLAAEVIEVTGSAVPDRPVFNAAELAMARRFVEESTKRHAVATESSSGG
jgi:hypothetical protein